MAIKQRGKIWWADFTTPSGERVRRSTKTKNKQEAQEFHDKLKAEYWRIHQLGEKPRRTWKEAAVKWVKEKGTKKDIEKDKAKLRWLDEYLKDCFLDQINRETLEFIADAREAEGSKPATVNRYLALIRAILRRAWQEWNWIKEVPPFPMLKEDNARNRWLTKEEAKRLMKALPEYYSLPARFTLATGPRQRNVLDLKWDQIDTKRQLAWVDGKDTKNGKGLSIPLNEDALAVLELCKDKHPIYVFTKNGEGMTDINRRVWNKALEEAKIEDFRWHDLRHTWASWHIQSGTSLAELKELGGWKTMEMVSRYSHLGGEHLLTAAKRIEVGFSSASDDENTQLSPEKGKPNLTVVK